MDIKLNTILQSSVISIIVTSYNQADTLPQTLDSILAQYSGWLAESHAKANNNESFQFKIK